MPDINILSPHVADMIAAGEVVERPASVIKELLENSFDAGSKNITIEIKGGGMTYIRVTDDGGGMLPEDAGLCFLRHATSKLRDERGLESIGTMGFRGEALAAVSSVSRVELLTKKRGTDVGTRVVLEAGDIIEMLPCGCPEGTTMIIRDLFFNTPARLKFMKSDRTESSACSSAALRCALGHPDVSVRLIKDGEDEFFSPGDGKLESCVYSLLGRETAMGLLELASNCEKVSVSGFVGSPKAGHGNRSKQFFFCNKRSIKSQLLQAAVEQAYKNTLLTGRYPACVVYLSVSPGAVDVNVHPAKTEVKFRDERQIFDAVYYAVLSALDGEKSAAEINLQPLVKSSPSPKKDFFKSMNAGEFREKYSGLPKTSGSTFPPRSSESLSHAIPPKPSPDIDKGTIVWNRTLSSGTSGASLVRESESPYISSGSSAKCTDSADSAVQEGVELIKGFEAEPVNEIKESPVQGIFRDVHDEFRLVGEAMKTYIIIEKGDELLLIDKHAAHERMIFDRLKEHGHEIMSQSLMIPVTMNMPADEIELIEQYSEKLSDLGFEIEPYGADSIILRGIPSGTDASDAAAMIEEICEKLKKGASLSESDAIDDILHTIACKAAIKAGWNTADEELLSIAEEVVSGKVKYCPHGRPVSIVLSKKQLDKEFSRIV
ncbi:MAG: DNA mismatch repair endonuclease MutL [Clostridiales bacterium]|nr:DNA mismatch repair endonuclease MutL [Clostridiales bacterium]